MYVFFNFFEKRQKIEVGAERFVKLFDKSLKIRYTTYYGSVALSEKGGNIFQNSPLLKKSKNIFPYSHPFSSHVALYCRQQY